MIEIKPIADDAILRRLCAINGRALSTTLTLHRSYQLARAVIENNIAGDLIECGVYAGSQCGAMAVAVQELKANKLIHCFDSFCGFPKASQYDDREWQARLGVGGGAEPSKPLDPAWGFDANTTVERVEANFSSWGLPLSMFRFHKGWFQETTPLMKEPIALLRIDGDLYESALVCLKNLYPSLSEGGVCIFDDYHLLGCRTACDEYFGDRQIKPVSFNPLEADSPVWWVKESQCQI